MRILPSLFLASSLIFSSCASFRLPGEERAILKNLSVEYYNIAEGYVGIKNYIKAIEYYKLAMRNPEVEQGAFYKLSRAYALSGDWESALECYGKMLERDPGNENLKVSVAYITAMNGDTHRAIELFRELNSEKPYSEQVLESYAALLLFVGRAEDAQEPVLELRKNFPDNKRLAEFEKQLSEEIEDYGEVRPPKNEGEAGEGESERPALPLKK